MLNKISFRKCNNISIKSLRENCYLRNNMVHLGLRFQTAHFKLLREEKSQEYKKIFFQFFTPPVL